MDLFRHQVAEYLVYQSMPGYLWLAGEFSRNDHELKMAAAVLRTRMTGMFVAVIEYFQLIRIQPGQPLANHFFDAHYFGKTLRRGFTMTLAKTPSVT